MNAPFNGHAIRNALPVGDHEAARYTGSADLLGAVLGISRRLPDLHQARHGRVEKDVHVALIRHLTGPPYQSVYMDAKDRISLTCRAVKGQHLAGSQTRQLRRAVS